MAATDFVEYTTDRPGCTIRVGTSTWGDGDPIPVWYAVMVDGERIDGGWCGTEAEARLHGVQKFDAYMAEQDGAA